jgi:hypothetical protein
LIEREPAVPDAPGLVTDEIELKREDRVCQIVGGIEQQCDIFSMLSVDRKIERLLLFYPRRP